MSGVIPKQWKSVLKQTYNRLSFVSPEIAHEIIESLELKKTYKDTEIIDCNPGCGVWSRALNETLRPRTHLLLEPAPKYFQWNEGFNPDLINAKLFNVDPYKWHVYKLLEQYGAFHPTVMDSSTENTELLLTGNFTNVQGGQVVSQFITCVAYRNWLQRFGRVRMLLWVRDSVAYKTVTPNSGPRGKLSALSELFTDTTVVATTADVDRKLRQTTEVLPLDRSASYPAGDLALLDIRPKAKQEWEHNMNMFEMEYVLRNIFITYAAPLGESIGNLGPGAADYFKPTLGHLFEKSTKELTQDEIVELMLAFSTWPFKPPHLFDMGEDSLEQNTAVDIVQFV